MSITGTAANTAGRRSKSAGGRKKRSAAERKKRTAGKFNIQAEEEYSHELRSSFLKRVKIQIIVNPGFFEYNHPIEIDPVRNGRCL